MPAFYICHHDPNRTHVTSEAIREAQDCNVGLRMPNSSGACLYGAQYDTLTTPITTTAFHTRVTALLSNHLYSTVLPNHGKFRSPTIPSLAPTDTYLAPGDAIPQSLGIVSPWIDLCSPDPIIYDVSRQVFELEVAYAAFCGLGALVLPSPRLHHGEKSGCGIARYACAIQQALQIGSFIHFSVTLQMMDNPSDSFDTESSLARLARAEFSTLPEDDRRSSIGQARKHDFFGTWDAWNIIRTVSEYHARLFVGKDIVVPVLLLAFLLESYV